MRYVCPHITLHCSTHENTHGHHEKYGCYGVFSPIFNDNQRDMWTKHTRGQRIGYIESALSTAIVVTENPQKLGRSHDSMCVLCQHFTMMLSTGLGVFVWEKLHVDRFSSVGIININEM